MRSLRWTWRSCRLRDPLDAFRARAAELAPGVRIEALAPGDSLELGG